MTLPDGARNPRCTKELIETFEDFAQVHDYSRDIADIDMRDKSDRQWAGRIMAEYLRSEREIAIHRDGNASAFLRLLYSEILPEAHIPDDPPVVVMPFDEAHARFMLRLWNDVKPVLLALRRNELDKVARDSAVLRDLRRMDTALRQSMCDVAREMRRNRMFDAALARWANELRELGMVDEKPIEAMRRDVLEVGVDNIHRMPDAVAQIGMTEAAGDLVRDAIANLPASHALTFADQFIIHRYEREAFDPVLLESLWNATIPLIKSEWDRLNEEAAARHLIDNEPPDPLDFRPDVMG